MINKSKQNEDNEIYIEENIICDDTEIIDIVNNAEKNINKFIEELLSKE